MFGSCIARISWCFLCFLCSCEDLDDEESSELDDFYVMFIDSIGVF